MDNISLRLATPEDDAFLQQLYIVNRLEEMRLAGSDVTQTESLIQMQYSTRKTQYDTLFPDALNWIILLDNEPVGRHLIQPEAQTWAFVDLAVLPALQNRGIGTFVFSQHLQQALRAGASAQLHVRVGNAAKRLYERQGFVVTGQDGVYYQMQYMPDTDSAQAALESLTPEVFDPLVGDVFRVEYLHVETEQTHVNPQHARDPSAGDLPVMVELKLVEVRRYPRIKELEGGFDHRVREPFSLLFEGRDDDPPLLSAVHPVRHDQLGWLRLFLNQVQVTLKPLIEKPSHSRFYEVVFS